MQSDQYNLGETERFKKMYYDCMDILQKIDVVSKHVFI
jgi:hypothetical protein